MAEMDMKTILIVDDDPLVRESTRLYLETNGYKAICAKNGEEAIQKHHENAADAALIDIFMPKRGGLETIMTMHESIPVIAMSGVSSHRFEPLEFAVSIGAKCALTKPFEPEELLEVLERILPAAADVH